MNGSIGTKHRAAAALLLCALLLGSESVGRMAAAGDIGQAGPTQVAAAASPSVSVGGAVENPRIFSLADLKAMPTITVYVFFHTDKGSVQAGYTGVSLWALLDEVDIKFDANVRNGFLRKFLVMTGADGYRVVLSLAEIDPEYGGQQVMLAYEEEGKELTDESGLVRLIVPGDKSGGRNVKNLVSIEVRSAD